MARTRCTICNHPERGKIDRDLLHAGDSAPVVAERYGLGQESVRRHRLKHLQIRPSQPGAVNNAMVIIGYAQDLYARAERLVTMAEGLVASSNEPARSVQAAATTLRELRQTIELLSKLVVTEPDTEAGTKDHVLDSLIAEQLAGHQLTALPPGHSDVVEAELVQ